MSDRRNVRKSGYRYRRYRDGVLKFACYAKSFANGVEVADMQNLRGRVMSQCFKWI